MPKAKQLWPDRDVLGQCEAQREGRYCPGWEAQHPDKRCSLGAKYEVDGKRFCSKHAGMAALRILLEKDDGTH